MSGAGAFSGKPNGWKFSIRTRDIFGDLSEWREYTYGGTVEGHGFHRRGSWALMALPGDEEKGWKPAYRAKVRRYKAREWRWLRLEFVEEIHEGWLDRETGTWRKP